MQPSAAFIKMAAANGCQQKTSDFSCLGFALMKMMNWWRNTSLRFHIVFIRQIERRV